MTTMHTVGRSAAYRALTLAVGAFCNLVIIRIVIDDAGVAWYAIVGLVATLVALLPFADLGVGAAITNAAAESDDPSTDARLEVVVVSSLRLLCASAGFLIALAAMLLMAGAWPSLLGQPFPEGSDREVSMTWAAALTLCFFALALPFSAGQRVLQGVGRNHIVVLYQGLIAPLALATTAVTARTGGSEVLYVLATPLASMIATAAAAIAAAHCLSWNTTRHMLSLVPFRRRLAGTRLRGSALPMVIIMTAWPIALYSDRLVLSHFSGLEALAQYSLAAQLGSPFMALTGAAGMALWPMFIQRRARGDSARSLFGRAVGIFSAVGVVSGLLFALAAQPVAVLVTQGKVPLGLALILSFAAFIVIRTTHWPAGMFLTTDAGLWFQARCALIALPLNLILSVLLAVRLGAAGPVLATALTMAFIQLLPGLVRVRANLLAEAAS